MATSKFLRMSWFRSWSLSITIILSSTALTLDNETTYVRLVIPNSEMPPLLALVSFDIASWAFYNEKIQCDKIFWPNGRTYEQS